MYWKFGLFQCLGDLSVCIMTIMLPCYALGMQADAVGDSCIVCGLMYCVPGINLAAVVCVRTKIRAVRRIQGTCLEDLATVVFCHPCAMIQQTREVEELQRRQDEKSDYDATTTATEGPSELTISRY
ncbi:cornifelin homolog A-like [Babylonia areolata]|uniref:cornifelin homolog A-like n=1 Tax=Babylonia areolata TaxID=304850 RepID=UPI003FD3678B